MTYVIVNITYVILNIGYAKKLHTTIPKAKKVNKSKPFRIKTQVIHGENPCQTTTRTESST